MKLLPSNVHGRVLTLAMLIALCSTTTLSAQRNKAQDKVTNDKVLYEKMQTLKPGMKQSEVKNLLGEPYKISFALTEEGDLIEDIYYKTYKTEIWQARWTIIIYQCVFKNDRLVALTQKEYFWDTTGNGATAPL